MLVSYNLSRFRQSRISIVVIITLRCSFKIFNIICWLDELHCMEKLFPLMLVSDPHITRLNFSNKKRQLNPLFSLFSSSQTSRGVSEGMIASEAMFLMFSVDGSHHSKTKHDVMSSRTALSSWQHLHWSSDKLIFMFLKFALALSACDLFLLITKLT